ncbi:MAG: GNAT family N-acetyltransferase [Woeseiaceae bacterium]|nr:GNAT family N-acetyltransferase [Woeseiaceae bacterium]
MREFERSKLPDLPAESERVPVGAFLRAPDNSIAGGITATIFRDGLEVETLWVANEHRGQGQGTKLLNGIEEFARSHGAVIAFLTTVEGRDFYEAQGYEVYGELGDRPLGPTLYHMKKRL